MANEINSINAGYVPVTGVNPRASSAADEIRKQHQEHEQLRERRQSLDEAVADIAEHFSSQRTDLRFRIDKDAGRVVVSVVDSSDGTVLRQIPGEEALRIARALKYSPNLVAAVA